MTIRAVLITLVIFGSLIFVHELGHFLFARLFHVGVQEFAIGMGPKLLSKVSKKSGIRYSLRLLPIGGYVSMEGEDEESQAPNAFNKKPVWQRLLVVLAGPFTNVLVGFLAMIILILGTGYLTSSTIAGFSDGAVSCADGSLEQGDKIIKVDGKRVFTGTGLLYAVMFETGEAENRTLTFGGTATETDGVLGVDVTVIRDGEKITLENVPFKTESQEGVTTCVADFIVYATPLTFFGVIRQSFCDAMATVRLIWQTLVNLVRGSYGLSAVSGPVGVTEAVSAVDTHDWLNVLYLFILISVNLGVCNLIPFPALDGGRILTLLIEMIIRKPLNRKIEGLINYVGLIILFALMIVITGKDVIHLIKK